MSKNLNEVQKEAVEHVDGPMLVLAGAGSGKTRIVTHRIARLLERGVLPNDIVAVTFTNKAAEEMRKRVLQLTGKKVLTCTFHSLGARILREAIPTLGYTVDFSIFDEEDSNKLLKTCLQSLEIKEERGLLKTLKLRISAAKNDLLSSKDFPTTSQDRNEELFLRIYPIYQQRLKDCNAVDFDDLLFVTVKLFQENPSLRQEYQNRWLFILIDEYQDTNLAQYTLTKLLVEKSQNLFAVGDPDQSIYSWRGARYQNILQFSSDFPGGKILTLEQNYRSTNTILEAANQLISHNTTRYDKKLFSELGEGEKIVFLEAQNEKEEVSFIWEQIQALRQKGISLEEIVVFYRTNAQSRIFEDLFLAKKLPYQIIGGISFYQRKEIKDLLAFLRMLISDSDFVSFLRTLPLCQKGLGTTGLKKLLEESNTRQIPIFVFLEKLLSDPSYSLTARQKQAILGYVTLVQTLRREKNSLTLAQLVQQVIQKTGYLTYLKEDPESFEDRKENLEAFVSKAAEFEQLEENPTLPAFLEELSLKSFADTAALESLKLMTLHNSKGLEFEAVFIAGLEEDLLPHINSKETLEEIEEERRLFYVGLTRAKKHLFLSYSTFRYMWGAPRLMAPSRFLKELPQELLQRNSLKAPRGKEGFSTQSSLHLLAPGTRVRHQEFGNGIIERAYHTSYGTTYDIYFTESDTTRSLVGKYAKLDIL